MPPKKTRANSPDGKPSAASRQAISAAASTTPEQPSQQVVQHQPTTQQAPTPRNTPALTNTNKLCPCWEHTIFVLLKYKNPSDNLDDITQWLKYQGLFDSMEGLIFWDINDFQLDSSMAIKSKQRTQGTNIFTYEYLNSAQYSLIKAIIQFAKFK
jgi:hypothetical protein